MEEITAEHDVSLVRRLFTISVRCVNDKVLITGCWKICGPLFQFKKLEIYKIPSSVCIMTALVSLLTDRLVFGLLALLITTLKQLFFSFFCFFYKNDQKVDVEDIIEPVREQPIAYSKMQLVVEFFVSVCYNLMSAKMVLGLQQTGRVVECSKSTCLEHSTGKQVHW